MQQEPLTFKKLSKLDSLLPCKWEKLIDLLVSGNLANLLNRKGIEVHFTSVKMSGMYKKRQFEFDIIAQNDKETVVVEVKTTLRPEDIKDFIEDLKQFKDMMPSYKNNRIIGAVAYLEAVSGAQSLAEKSGLFVIKATGSSASIINSDEFSPKLW